MQSQCYRSPLVLIRDSVVAAHLVHDAKQSMQVDVFVVDRRRFVQWCACLVEELVQLCDEAVLLLAWFVVRTVRQILLGVGLQALRVE